MADEQDPVFRDPAAYGIENIDEPGEPDRDRMPTSEPVPGTGRQAREQHMREHDAQRHLGDETDLRDRRDRVELEEARQEAEDPGPA